MEMKKLMEDISAIMEGQLPDYYYHGSSSPITNFSDEFVGRGNDEYGPGIYFSSVPSTAIGYAKDGANGVVYQCQLSLRKVLSKKQKINKAVLLKLMQATPDDEAYTNWDENQNRAYQNALNSYIDAETNMYDALMDVWYDWYRYHGTEFVRNLVQIGYDGYIYEFPSGERFVVVYNPASIKVVNSYSPEEALQTLVKSK